MRVLQSKLVGIVPDAWLYIFLHKFERFTQWQLQPWLIQSLIPMGGIWSTSALRGTFPHLPPSSYCSPNKNSSSRLGDPLEQKRLEQDGLSAPVMSDYNPTRWLLKADYRSIFSARCLTHTTVSVGLPHEDMKLCIICVHISSIFWQWLAWNEHMPQDWVDFSQ